MTSQKQLPCGTAKSLSRPARRRWWVMPFSTETWRQTIYVVIALPASLAFMPIALLGGHRRVARWQRGLTRRYLPQRTGGPPARDTAWRVAAHAVLSLPLNLVSLVVTGYLWLGVPLNFAYPLRPGAMESYQRDWGGPSLAGAWAFHAAGGVAALFLTPWVVQALTWLQARLTRGLLGAG
jgi:hypothetical protein